MFADQQYWLIGHTHHTFGDAAQEQAGKTTPATRANDNQVRRPDLGFGSDGFGDAPVEGGDFDQPGANYIRGAGFPGRPESSSHGC